MQLCITEKDVSLSVSLDSL